MKLASLEGALGGKIAPDLPVRFVRLETLIRMKEGTGRDKDEQDIRQLKKLSENKDDEG